MPVVELHRASDDATWYLQVGDEHDTRQKIEEKALKVANGFGENQERVMPGNGEPGWTVERIHADDKFHSLYLQEGEYIA
jgi:hypothetical protein